MGQVVTSEEFQAQRKKRPSKFRNVRSVHTDGTAFHSKAEMGYYDILRFLEKQGKIRELRRQVPFSLLSKPKLQYIADFTFFEPDRDEPGAWNLIVVDVKGDTAPLDPFFKFKWRCMKEYYPEIVKRIIRAKSVKGRYSFREDSK